MMASRRRLLGLAVLLIGWVAADRLAVPAWADDAGLVAKLAALSAAKGSGREFFPEICAALCLPAAICGKTASCREVNEREAGTAHSLTGCRAGSDTQVYVVIGVYDRTSGYSFWAGPDGSMRSAMRLEIAPSANRYIPVEPRDQAAQARYSQEIAYWRGRQDALAKEPDARR